jgi:hypothetical protein
VSGRSETNVRIPECAWDALEEIVARWSKSRDETVRLLLAAHVEHQERRPTDDRLTHISTVLRYPRPRRFQTQPKPGRQLRLRLEPQLAAAAKRVSLVLPGQSVRSHRDYQARLMTDAVMTAIAVEEPFTDEFLDGFVPILRHGSALGLWQLAVAATSSRPEDVVFDAAKRLRLAGSEPVSSEEAARRKKLSLVAEALEEEAWHDDIRFVVTTNIARQNLRGRGAAAYEERLYERRQAWDDERQNLRHSTNAGWLWEGVPYWFDVSGRGSAAVWRAQRRVELDDFEDWLVKDHGDERRVEPPGWLVRVPDGWHARRMPEVLPEPYASWKASGKVLSFFHRGGELLWPLTRDSAITTHGWIPVPGIESVVAGAADRARDKPIALIESLLVDWQVDDEEHRETVGHLLLPADKAYTFGFIDAATRTRLMGDARATTVQSMQEVLDTLRPGKEQYRHLLQAAAEVGNAREFGRIAAKAKLKFTVIRPVWRWPYGSIAGEVLKGTDDGTLRWLAGWTFRDCRRILHSASEQAWHAGFDRLPADHWTS